MHIILCIIMHGNASPSPGRYPLAVDDDWTEQATRILDAELRRKGVSRAELARRLGEHERTVSNKIGAGKFSLAWFLKCLHLIGARRIELD